jgi:hypothetical protein
VKKARKKTQRRNRKQATLGPQAKKRRALRKKEADARRKAYFDKLVKGRL